MAYSDTKAVCTFDDEFKRLIEQENYKDSLKYIRDKANIRNKLLYANSSGRSKIEVNIEEYLKNQKKKVMIFLIIVLMIDPWEKKEGKSLFVQQILDSYLLLMGKINSDDINQPHKKINLIVTSTEQFPSPTMVTPDKA